jgi:phosphoribosyl 1,2-cyclic phosphodiesterase
MEFQCFDASAIAASLPIRVTTGRVPVRPSGKNILIDCGPEFRLQALRSSITSLSFVLITRTHADHIFGLDDLRVFSEREPVVLFAVLVDMQQKAVQEGSGVLKFHCVGIESFFEAGKELRLSVWQFCRSDRQ